MKSSVQVEAHEQKNGLPFEASSHQNDASNLQDSRRFPEPPLEPWERNHRWYQETENIGWTAFEALERTFLESNITTAEVFDELMLERSRNLQKNPWLYAKLRRFLDFWLRTELAQEYANQFSKLDSRDIIPIQDLILQLNQTNHGVENIPKKGRFILVCNHPTGLSDGSVLLGPLLKKRSDVMIYANSDILRLAPQFTSFMIPIRPVARASTRQERMATVLATKALLEGDHGLVVFPAGRIAYFDGKRIGERPWQPTVVKLAKKYNAQILPAHVSYRNSLLFYVFSLIHDDLRDLSFFFELLNKRGREVVCRFGEPIAPEQFRNEDSSQLTSRLQHYVSHDLPKGLPFSL